MKGDEKEMARVWLTDEKSVKIEGKRLKILEALSFDAMSQANLIKFLQLDGFTSNNITDEVRDLTVWGFITNDGSLMRLTELGTKFTTNLERVRAAAEKLKQVKRTLSQQEAKAAEREYMDLLWSLGSNERVMYDLDREAYFGDREEQS